jgi:cysteinyl-tRNA synthetase
VYSERVFSKISYPEQDLSSFITETDELCRDDKILILIPQWYTFHYLLSFTFYLTVSLHLYNTLTRSLEVFKPLKQDEVKVYYCGPTPYNYAHIGNLRNYLMDDIVVRTMRFLGYKVKTVMNVTDIDDKTIRDSQKSGKSLKEFTEFYTSEFIADCARLGIIPADTIAPISTLIPDMGAIIDGLLQK